MTHDRKLGLGASDAAPACGLSKWKTPLQLYNEKLSLAEGTSDNLPMQIGRALEPVVLQKFADERGLTLSRMQERIVDPTFNWRWVTVDAIAEDGALVEAKTSGYGTGFTEEEIPLEYALQIQHGLAVTGLEIAYLPVLIAGRDFRIYDIQRDEELIDLLTDNELRFWQRVQEKNPPAPTSLSEVNATWRVSNPEVPGVIADDSGLQSVESLRRLKGELKELELAIENREASIKLRLGEAERFITADGRVLATWTSQTSKRLDQTALKTGKPDVFTEYLRDVPSRVFRLK